MDTTTRRWSELIPPHNALTFAAIWDPDEGMVTFSGGKLLDSDVTDSSDPRNTPRDILDGQSQVLTFDRITLPLPSGALFTDAEGRRTGAPTVTFACAALDDAQSVVDPYLRYIYREPESSEDSTEHSELNVRDARKAKHRRQGVVQLDWLQLQSIGRQLYSVVASPFERRNDHASSEDDTSVTDEGFFEEVPWTAGTSTSAPVLVNLNLKSAFSVTTTSTTGYVDVDVPSVTPSGNPLPDSPSVYSTPFSSPSSEAWSTLQKIEYGTCPNMRRGRRLKKLKPISLASELPLPADPAEVLARTSYNHSMSQADSPTSTSEEARRTLRRQKSMVKAVKGAIDRLTKCRKEEDERWVIVNISHKVTQHVCALAP